MNKYSIISAIAITIIVIPFLFSGMSILGVRQLEYRWYGPGEFSFFTMSNNGQMEFCNNLPFWMSFQEFKIMPYYTGTQTGTYTVKQLTLNPASSGVQEGKFFSEDIVMAQQTFMNFDFEFDGGEIRLDPNQFITIVKIETPILGIIPYTTTMQMSGFDLDQKMKSSDLTCD
ncbi:MAG: thr operon leader peptide [Nitrosopumilus sp.]